jgi:general nucleoside transport system permease protein
MSAPTELGLWSIPLVVFGRAILMGTPYLYVSLGECITEKSGRVNLGQEGNLFLGALTGFAVSYHFGSPWLGVLAAGCVGILMGVLHAVICNLPRVNYVAVGIALMMFGMGLSWYLGDKYIGKKADRLPSIPLGDWSSSPQIQDALKVNVLFVVGVILAPVLWWMLANTRWGLVLRLAGESEEAAAAMGYSVNRIRTVATAIGGFLAGVAGSYLSLYFPGSWNEQISTGQGLMAVALVIFARWNPIYCLFASLLFGGVGSLSRVLQSLDLITSSQAYLWDTAPYVMTLVIMIITSSRARAMIGAPLELSRVR